MAEKIAGGELLESIHQQSSLFNRHALNTA
jgi:hypothetical protein